MKSTFFNTIKNLETFPYSYGNTHTHTNYNIAFLELNKKYLSHILGDPSNPGLFNSILIFDILIHQKAKLLLWKYRKTAKINILIYPLLDCIISLGPT